MANLSKFEPEEWIECPHCGKEEQDISVTFFGRKKGVVIACAECNNFTY